MRGKRARCAPRHKGFRGRCSIIPSTPPSHDDPPPTPRGVTAAATVVVGPRTPPQPPVGLRGRPFAPAVYYDDAPRPLSRNTQHPSPLRGRHPVRYTYRHIYTLPPPPAAPPRTVYDVYYHHHRSRRGTNTPVVERDLEVGLGTGVTLVVRRLTPMCCCCSRATKTREIIFASGFLFFVLSRCTRTRVMYV